MRSERGGTHEPSFPRKRKSKGWGLSFDKLRACAGLDPVTNELSAYIP